MSLDVFTEKSPEIIIVCSLWKGLLFSTNPKLHKEVNLRRFNYVSGPRTL